MSDVTDFLWHIFYPNRCAFCGKIVFYNQAGCSICEEFLPRITHPITITDDSAIDTLIAPFYYHDSVAKAIKDLKFNGVRDNAKKLAHYMVIALKRDAFKIRIDAVIPVPMYIDDVADRGYNQSALLAKEVSRLTGIPLVCDILVKHTQTAKQHDLDSAQRAQNLNGALSVENDAFGKLLGLTILLVDDVFTTGTTANLCASLLLNHGAGSVICLTAAKTYYKSA